MRYQTILIKHKYTSLQLSTTDSIVKGYLGYSFTFGPRGSSVPKLLTDD